MGRIVGQPLAERKGLRLKTTIATFCLAACLCAAAFAEQPTTYGTTATSYISLGPGAFQPQVGTTTFQRDYFLAASSPSSFWVYPQLPSGALVTSIALDFCQDVGGNGPLMGFGLLDRFGSETDAGLIAIQIFPSGCSTETMSNLGPIVVDSATNRLVILVDPIGTQKFAGLVIGYQLQVSPAPASPSFNDVPASDFGFQYIEALAASGITGGCGGGKFCPDAAVTRRQMAIFLAKALGLQWP